MFIVSFCFLIGSIDIVDYTYIKEILSYIFYGFILLTLLEIGVDERFVQRFINFGTFVCFLALLQWVLLIFGVKFVEIFPFLTNTLGQSYPQLQVNLQRVCGPFTEPAHLAQYLNILLILMLFSKKVYWHLILLIIFVLGLTHSGNALVLTSFVLVAKLITSLKSWNLRSYLCFIISLIIASVCLGVALNVSDELRKFLLRAYEITGNSNIEALGYISSSGYFRVKYGYDFFMDLSLINKIFGIGIGGFDLVLPQHDVIPEYLKGTFPLALLHYRSALTMILIDIGIVGFVIYIWALFSGKNKNAASWSCGFLLVIMQLISSFINSSTWVLLILIQRYFLKK